MATKLKPDAKYATEFARLEMLDCIRRPPELSRAVWGNIKDLLKAMARVRPGDVPTSEWVIEMSRVPRRTFYRTRLEAEKLGFLGWGTQSCNKGHVESVYDVHWAAVAQLDPRMPSSSGGWFIPGEWNG